MKQELTGMFESLALLSPGSKTCIGRGSATAAGQLNRRIDALKTATRSMPEATRTALGGFLNEQIAGIKAQAKRVLSLPGLPEQLKTIVKKLFASWKISRSAQARP